MVGRIDDHQAPYNNHFDAAKRFSKVLFRPGRPAFSQELLETESIQDNQLEMLGDSLFQEGAIISGMEIIPKPDNTINTKKDSMPNSFSVSSLFAEHTRLDTSDYVANGNINVLTEANMSSDIAGFDFTGTATKGLGMVVSFGVTQQSGVLNRINLVADDSKLDLIKWTIDDEEIATPIGDIANATQLVDKNGNQIKLNDGKEHKVAAYFKTKEAGRVDFTLDFNAGYDLTTDSLAVKVSHLYVEDYNKVTDWQLNPADSGTASSTQRIKNYTVSSGRVYLDGKVREFDAQDFSIKGIGKEVIGLRLDEDIVTSAQDPSLLDDTPGSITRGDAGADRLHYNVVLTYNDDSATPFATFQDNVLNQRAIKPDYSKLEPILAKRTYDQSGSFRSYGFDAHLRANPDLSKGAQDPNDASKILLDIDAGQAYVRGYSISTSAPTTLHLDVANELSTATNEGYYYKADHKPIRLLNQPVKKVVNVTYTARADDTVTHPAGGEVVDHFATDKNVTFVRRVYQQSIEYKEGQDFTYIGNEIHWAQDLTGTIIPGAKVPSAGQSYHVVYDYATNAEEGKDYKVTNDSGVTYVDIDGMSGAKPIQGSVVNITYNYFTARIDMIRITMDQSNPFKVIKGTPAPLNKVTPPSVKDPLSLELGYVLIQPNSYKAIFTMQTITRITFDTLQQWGIRLTNTEYNVAIDRMNEAVKRSEDPTILKDAFADGFASINNRDDEHTTVAYDFENGEILMPSQAQASLTPTINEDISNIALKGEKGHLVVPPYHEEVVINQPIATGTVNVNEFNIFSANGNLTIDPSSDNWVDTTSTVAYTTRDMGTVNLHKWWRHTNDQNRAWQGDGRPESAWAADERIQEKQWDKLNGIVDTDAGNTLGETGWMIADGGASTSETMIEYMRPNHINFTATNLSPIQDGYSITIDGTPVQNPTPADDKYKGVKANEFKTDAKGEIKGSFNIPGGTIRCGTRVVKITNSNGDIASANYTANGTLKTTTNTIEKRVYTVNLWDPLAQSFYLNETRQLSSVDLYFLKKPTPAAPGEPHKPQLIIQIRELADDGYPNRVVRGEVYIDPENIKTSEDGSVFTRITFNDSITLNANQGYAIVLISDSDEYKLFKATKGESVVFAGASETGYNSNPSALMNKDPKATGKNITITNRVSANVGDVLSKAPNSNGDMFISNNGMTWTADGASSLKFRVNVCDYLKNGEVVFDPIILSDWNSDTNSVWNVMDKGPDLDGKKKTPNTNLSFIDRLATLTQFLTYQNTSLHWYIRIFQNSDLGGASGNNINDLIQSMPWRPLNVINGGQVQKAPASRSNQVPVVTSSNDPQQVGGELNLFQNTLAIQLKAQFNVDQYIAPVLTTEDLSLAAVLTGSQAEYESIDMDESGDAAFNKVKLQFDGYLPDVGTNLPHINPMYSVDGGNTWYNFPSDGKASKSTDKDAVDTSKPTSTKQVSAYFTRYTYEATVPNIKDQNSLAKRMKIRLKLQAPNHFKGPRVRQLSCVMKRDLDNE